WPQWPEASWDQGTATFTVCGSRLKRIGVGPKTPGRDRKGMPPPVTQPDPGPVMARLRGTGINLRQSLLRALEPGINFFETADMYSDGEANMQHLDDAVAALALKSKEDLWALAEPYKPHPVLGNLR
ncbi:MAG TPA: hypothetical protein VES94_05955, partial [Burkholderiales bacterium]|nr:hypothetical protein [Burkholderiales bacterium]